MGKKPIPYQVFNFFPLKKQYFISEKNQNFKIISLVNIPKSSLIFCYTKMGGRGIFFPQQKNPNWNKKNQIAQILWGGGGGGGEWYPRKST